MRRQEKQTVPAPPPPTMDDHGVALAILRILVNENAQMRQSLREMETVNNAA
jgi:hypothetical protein